MVYTGPQKIPGASLTYWYQDNYPGTRMESNVGVVHTTEGRTLPSYSGGASAPNVTLVPDFAKKVLKIYQHFDVDMSSRALRNQSGGVQTNTANAFQIELVGTCDPATKKKWSDAGYQFIYWPEAPDWALAELAKLVRWLKENHLVKAQSTVTWKAYPGSYGNSDVRLSGAEWTAYYGWLGHQHVPENDHGDPGNINFKRVLELANGEVNENVAITKADVGTVYKTDGVIKSPDYLLDSESNKFWTAESYFYETYRLVRTVRTEAAQDRATVQAVKDSLAALHSKVDVLATGSVNIDAIAAKVADLLAARLAE